MFTASMVKITGIGVAYPPNLVPVEQLASAAYARYKPSPAQVLFPLVLYEWLNG